MANCPFRTYRKSVIAVRIKFWRGDEENYFEDVLVLGIKRSPNTEFIHACGMTCWPCYFSC